MERHKTKDLQVPCIVCGEYVTWDDSPMPAACGTHTYQEVFEAYDAAQQGAQTDVCPKCQSAECEYNPQFDWKTCLKCGTRRTA